MSEQNRIDQHTLDLLNGGIDGELSPVEQQELDVLLAGSEEVRDIRDELEAFSRLLEDTPEIEPPAYLQESIEKQIRLPVPGEEKNLGVFSAWFSAHWLRTGFALAAGIFLTVGVYEMGSGPTNTMDSNKMVGTVVKSQSPGQGKLLDSVHVVTDTLNGQVELRRNDDLFTLDVKLVSDGPTGVEVNFADRGLDFEGITRVQESNDVVSVVDGTIKVASSGEQHYSLKLRRTAGTADQQSIPLDLEFFANETLVHQAELSIPR
jgi:hypothetical protein